MYLMGLRHRLMPRNILTLKMNKRKPSLKKRNELIEQYQRYAYFVAHRLIKVMNLPASSTEELVAAANLGLVEAAERFRGKDRDSFQKFASFRIRGSIIDYLRKSSTLSATAYRYARALEATNEIKDDDNQLNEESCDKQKSSESKLALILDFAAKGALAYRMSFSETEHGAAPSLGEQNNPEQAYEQQEQRRAFIQLIKKLPERERIIIEEYYYHGRSFVDIAKSHPGMSKSWVSRLHNRALEHLKDYYVQANKA